MVREVIDDVGLGLGFSCQEQSRFILFWEFIGCEMNLDTVVTTSSIITKK